MGETILEFKDICKDFSGVKVLQNISFAIERGTCHCLIGENGAGKSTLIKILTGVYTRSSGTILYEGKDYLVHSTKEAFKEGISCVFQELNMVDALTVRENITLGREKTKFGLLQKDDDAGDVIEVLQQIEPDIELTRLVGTLSFAQKQMLEIAKAVGSGAKVIILDEPTAALTVDEVEKLFDLIRALNARGVTIIYISHRLEELFQIGDKITVLKDGCLQDTLITKDGITRQQLISLMTGKILTEDYTPNKVNKDKVVLSVKEIVNAKLKDISFDLYEGEVLGVYGLVGAGKSETARAIYGEDVSVNEIEMNGQKYTPKNPKDSISKGIVLIPEERRQEGLCTILAIEENVPMMNYGSVVSGKLFSSGKGKHLAEKYIDLLRIVCNHPGQQVSTLSGGNQQKVVLAKCMNAAPELLLLDEPTRGVDVGAKQEIYTLIREMSANGSSVIVFSSEFPEIANLCDRVVLLHEGRVKKILENDGNLDSEYVMNIVTGGEDQA